MGSLFFYARFSMACIMLFPDGCYGHVPHVLFFLIRLNKSSLSADLSNTNSYKNRGPGSAMQGRTTMLHKIYRWAVTVSVLMLFAAPVIAQEISEPAGHIVAIRGQASAYDTKGNMRTLAIKSAVYEYDTLKTGANGRIQVLFSDNTIVSLGRKSVMEIAEYLWDPDRKTGAMKTRVKEGVFRVMGGAITKESPQNFTTETPAATIGIRGSMYAGKVSNQQLMVVFEGGKGIDVTNEVGRTSITRPGYGTHVMGSDLPPLPPRRFSQEEVSELTTQLSTHVDPDQENNEESAPSGSEDATENEGEAQQTDEEAVQPDSEVSEDQNTTETNDDSTPEETFAGTDTADADTQDTTMDSTDDYSDETPLMQDTFTTNDETPLEANTPEDPLTTTALSVSQEIITSSTTASQDNLEDTVTQTAQTGITLSGAFLSQCTADMTTTDFTTWYGNSAQATAINGSVAGDATTQNSVVFDFSFAMNPYNPDDIYSPPFDMTGDPIADMQTRYVGLPGVGQNFQAAVISDNLGEFAAFLIKDGLFTSGSTQYGYRDLGFVGIETLASQMPTNGLSGYFGCALGVDIDLISGNTMHIDTELSKMFMEVNWLSGKAIGRIDFDMDTTPSPTGQYPGGKTFFFADVSGNTLTNIRLCGYGGHDETATPGIVTWVEGTGEFARFYGSEYQGIGITGTGTFYDIETDQSSSIGTGRMIAAGFREPQDNTDVTSPTGTSLFNGFVMGLSENMNDIYTDRRLFMNSDPNDFSFTIDRNAGTLSGTLSATDQFSGTSSLNFLEIGMSHGSAYVLEDNMVAIIGDTGSDAIESNVYTGGLKPYGNYLITGGIDEQFSEYVTWGYWEISYEDPESAGQYHLHVPGSLWIAGELTPTSMMNDLAANNITGTYSGGAKGIRINDLSEVSELTNGSSQIQVNFGTYQVTGNITFDEINLPLTATTLSPSTSSFTTQITGATSSSVNGAFFGPNAEAIGGNFDAQFSIDRYMGIFGGERPTP